MSETSDGGPAFSGGLLGDNFGTQAGKPYEPGMSLRDYFATHIGTGGQVNQITAEILAGRPMPLQDGDIENYLTFWFDVEAKLRYMRADALIRERSK